MEAALVLLKAFGAFALDSIKLLLDPKVWLLLVIAGGACFVRGCQHEEIVFDQYKALIEKTGEQQEAFTKQRNAENKTAQQEVDHENEMALDVLADKLTAAEQRLLADSRGSFVPGASASPDKSVQPGQAPVGQPIITCFDANVLDSGIRAGVDRLQQRFARLAQSCGAALTSLPEWREWAGKVGSCEAVIPSSATSSP